jgi:hypothetical protein
LRPHRVAGFLAYVFEHADRSGSSDLSSSPAIAAVGKQSLAHAAARDHSDFFLSVDVVRHPHLKAFFIERNWNSGTVRATVSDDGPVKYAAASYSDFFLDMCVQRFPIVGSDKQIERDLEIGVNL